MPRYNPGGDETLRSNKAIGESPDETTPQSENSRHVYLSKEEFEKFSRGVPIERETDGLELTIFPPSDRDRRLEALIESLGRSFRELYVRHRDDRDVIIPITQDPVPGRRRARARRAIEEYRGGEDDSPSLTGLEEDLNQ